MFPLIGSLGTPELLILFGILVLLFGATKLPDLARGTGRALRIFKDETKGLMDHDASPEAVQAPAHRGPKSVPPVMEAQQAVIDAERARVEHPDAI